MPLRCGPDRDAAGGGSAASLRAATGIPAYDASKAGRVDKVRLQRVADVMQQFLGFGTFGIGSMLMGSG